MKITMKKSFAVIMSLVMCVSVLFSMNLSAFAADTNTVNYVYSGNYVYNWGTREETATFLSPMAIDFYTDNNVSLENLLALSGSSTESSIPSSTLYRELQELMESNHTYTNSYEAVKNLCQYTDCQNSGGKISSFYSGKEIGPEWNSSEWNREHTWPNSKGDKAGNGENDIMMLRPTASSENSSRGNKAYGTETTTQYYNPNDEGDGAYDLRGDVARIILYQYVRWECTNTGSSYNSTGIFGSNGVIESKDVLLDWIEEDPVDTWELGRNDAVEAITGTRNVFVDYPELAFDLFNEDVPADYTSPSDGVSVEGTTGTGGSGNTGDNTGDDTTSTPGAQIVFNLGANGTATHSDGSSKTTYTETVDGYTLNITGGSSFYTGARDAKGNSAFKMGTSSKAGSFSMTVPDDVDSVILNVAQYKANTTKISVNGTAYTITTASDNGAYTPITVDTTTTKTISFTTVSGGYRCMIDSITFVVAGSNDDTTDQDTVFVEQDDLVISGPSSAFDESVVVTATKLTAGDDFNTAQTALADKASQFTLYDITATVGSTAVQPSGEITITLGIPSGYDPDHVCIAYISNDGTVEELETSSIDKAANTVSATLEHFSLYAVIDTSNVSTDDGDDSGDDTSGTTTTEIVFELGANGTATHKDGSTDKSTYTETVGDYTLNLTGGTKCYPSSYDAKGNSAIKLGSSSAVGGFNFTVPDEVTSVVILAAKYKTNTTKINVNGTAYTLTQNSNDGNYDEIIVDTSTTKTVTFTTVSGGVRCMVNTIKYIISGSSGGDTPTYTVTAESNNTSYGTVTLSGNVITAKAKAGYTISGYDANPADAAQVTDNGDGTFTVSEPTADVTITINFVALPTYTVQFNENETPAEPMTKYEGGQITLPEHTSAVPDGYEFEGWAEAKDETDYTKIFAAGTKYTVTGNVTLYAQYSKVSSTPTSTVTIDFTNTTDRISQSSSQQVWASEGATVTNTQANGSSAVVADVNPVKFYAKSSLTIACTGMTQIVITASSGTYANVWQTTLASHSDIKRISVSGSVVTIEFNSAVDLLEIASLSAQTRIYSMEITKEANLSANEYTVTYIENGEETASTTLTEGTIIALPNDTITPSDKNFVGWATQENATSGILEAGSSYTVNADVTFYAQYTDKTVESSSHNFVKVTENQTDWSGMYLIVYEDGNKAFNGSLTSLKTANGLDVSIVDSKIKATDSTLAACFTIEAIEGGYTIKSASGYYIGRTSANTDSNDLLFNKSTKYVNSISLTDGNLNIVSGNTYLRWNDSSSFFRYYRSTTYTGQKPIALYKLDVAEISGAQVTIGADLSVNYYVDGENFENFADGDLTMRFTLGEDAPVTVNGKLVDGQYVFTFTGLAPQRMGDNIKAELIYKGAVIGTKDEYSVKQNAINLLSDNPSDELKQFVSDMLYYGAAAQEYTGYKKTELVTDGLEDILNAPLDEPLTEDYNKLKLTQPTADARFKSATVWFDAVNKLIVKVNNPNSDAIKVYVTPYGGTRTELAYNSEVGGYMTNEIKITAFQTTYTFELCDADGNVIQTLEYSINSYAYSKQNSTNPAMAKLALALFRLGQSAENI